MVDSLSKRYSACGIRLGCLATRNREVYGAACAWRRAGSRRPASRSSSALGRDRARRPTTRRASSREYQARRDVLFEGLSRIPGVFLRKPEGAFYFVARLPVDDGEDFARWLLTDFALDGRDRDGRARARASTRRRASAGTRCASPTCSRREDLEAAVRVLAHAIPAYQAAHAAPARWRAPTTAA